MIKRQALHNEDIHMANKYMKIRSASLVIRKIQSETTVQYHGAVIRVAQTFQKISTLKFLILLLNSKWGPAARLHPLSKIPESKFW